MTPRIRMILAGLSIVCSFGGGTVPALAAEDGPQTSNIEFDFTLDAVSDYRFRGVSLSDRDPAVQPSLTITHSSGLHAGVWGSNVADNGGDDIEVDVTAGYGFKLAGFDADLGGVYYLYPGAGSANYVEALASLSHGVGPATLGVQAGYVPRQNPTGNQDSLYLAVTGSAPIAGPISASGSFGRENGAFGDHKLDWSLGLDADLGKGFSASLSYVDTRHAFAGDNGRAGVVLKASKSF